MINHTCCNCIKTLRPVSPLATDQGVAGGGGALLTAVTGGSLIVGSGGNTSTASIPLLLIDSGFSLVKLVTLGNCVNSPLPPSDCKHGKTKCFATIKSDYPMFMRSTIGWAFSRIKTIEIYTKTIGC